MTHVLIFWTETFASIGDSHDPYVREVDVVRTALMPKMEDVLGLFLRKFNLYA